MIVLLNLFDLFLLFKMLVLPAVLFALLSTRSVLSAPLRLSPEVELEAGGEVSYQALNVYVSH